MSKKRSKGPKGPESVPGEGSVSYVSLIQDPYGIRSHEISEAQESNEELPLNEIPGGIEGEDAGNDEGQAAGAQASAEADAPLESDPNAPWLDATADVPEAGGAISDEDEPATGEIDPTEAAALASAAGAQGGILDDDRLRRARELPDLDADDWDEIPSQGIDISQLRGELAGEAREELEEFKVVPDTGELDSMARAMAEQDEIARSAASEIADWTPDVQADKKAAEEREQVRIQEDQALQAEQDRAEKEALEAQAAEEEGESDAELEAALPHPDPETGALDLAEVQSCLEALLFMLDKPATLERLREMIGPDFPLNVFQEAVTALKDKYKSPAHGIEVVEVAGGYQYRTKAGRAPLARKLAKVTAKRLSAGAMETLAIVAYRQPVMKEDVDKIRGVDSSYFVKNLLDNKLIRITGRSELPGRPMLYNTTEEFLSLFGLKDLSSMPSLREIEQMIPASQTGKGDEDPRVKEMRRLVNQMTTDTSTTLNYDPKEDEKILKEIKDRVSSIPSSTPYLEEQKAAEKAAKELAAQQAATPPAAGENGTEPGVNAGTPEPLP